MTPTQESACIGDRLTLLLSLPLLAMAGCASTRYEPPLEVAPQPPAITASATIPESTRTAGSGNEEVEVSVRRRASPTTRNSRSDLSVQEVREQNAVAPAPLDFGERLDYAHDQVYTWVQGVVEATDHRFAPKDQEPKPIPAAPFRLGLALESLDRSDGLELNLNVNFNIALRLPNIEDRLRLFVTSDELDESPRDARSESALRAGVRYQVFRAFDFDLGVKLDLPPVAFTSLRWQRQYNAGRWEIFPLLLLFADTDAGVGYVAAATFDNWAGRRLFRSSSYTKWRDDRDRIEWTQTLIYAHANQLIVPDRYGSYVRANDIGHGWGVRLLASGGEKVKDIEYYEAGVFYRRPAPNRWLYWFVEPLVRWDKQYNWNTDPGIRIGIDALFWDLARPARR